MFKYPRLSVLMRLILLLSSSYFLEVVDRLRLGASFTHEEDQHSVSLNLVDET